MTSELGHQMHPSSIIPQSTPPPPSPQFPFPQDKPQQTRNHSPFPSPIDRETSIGCTSDRVDCVGHCQHVSNEGEMICCDMCSCWSHVSCIEILLPNGGQLPEEYGDRDINWQCPRCMVDKREDYQTLLSEQHAFL